jgi:hypothetical protein
MINLSQTAKLKLIGILETVSLNILQIEIFVNYAKIVQRLQTLRNIEHDIFDQYFILEALVTKEI